jgi:hypothetical protein
MDSLLLGCIDVAAVVVAFNRLPAIELHAANAAHPGDGRRTLQKFVNRYQGTLFKNRSEFLEPA